MPETEEQFICAAVNLNDLSILPTGWTSEIARVAKTFATRVYLNGYEEDSREPEIAPGTDYSVVPGDLVNQELPWLARLYQTSLLEIASRLTGKRLSISKSQRLGVNINLLKGKFARYEWHVDPSPISGVLFVTTHADGDGGELALKISEASFKLSPQAGVFVIFAGSLTHCVQPLLAEATRITVPMVFFNEKQEEGDYSALESYLYTPRERT